MNMINWFISILLNSYTILIIYAIYNILKYSFNKAEYFKNLKRELTYILAYTITGTISHIYLLDVFNYDFKYLFDQFKQETTLFIFYHFVIGFIFAELWFILIAYLIAFSFIEAKQLEKNYLEIFKYEHDAIKRLNHGYKDCLRFVILPLILNINILNIFIYLLIKISIFWSKFLNINSFLNAISTTQPDDYFETLMTALFFYNIMPFVLKNSLSIVRPIKAILTSFMDYVFRNYKNQKNETNLFKIKV